MNIILLVLLFAVTAAYREETFLLTIKPLQQLSFIVDVGADFTIPSCITGESNDGRNFTDCAPHALLGWFLDTCAFPPAAKGTTWNITVSTPGKQLNVALALEDVDIVTIDHEGEGYYQAGDAFPGFLTGSVTFNYIFNLTKYTWEDVNMEVEMNISITVVNKGALLQLYANPGCPQNNNYAFEGKFDPDTSSYYIYLQNPAFQKFQSSLWSFFLVGPPDSGPVEMVATLGCLYTVNSTNNLN